MPLGVLLACLRPSPIHANGWAIISVTRLHMSLAAHAVRLQIVWVVFDFLLDLESC